MIDDGQKLQRLIVRKRKALARARWWDTVAYRLGKIAGSVAWVIL